MNMDLNAAPVASLDAEQVAAQLAQTLAQSAVERDRAGGHAATERALIRASGLLALSPPRSCGGSGLDWQTIFRTVRILAQADSALAHVYAFHHLQMATLMLYGEPAHTEPLLRMTVRDRLFWGNALNPNDKRALAVAQGDGFVVQGPKSYCSGSVGADWLTLSAWHEPTQSLLIAAVPSDRAGLRIEADWDAFGQRQTDSGTVHFNDVYIEPHEVLLRPGATVGVRTTLRSQLAQLVLTNLYTGIAQGVLAQGLAYTRQKSRAWPASGVARAVDDPFVQHRYGELRLLLRPAEVMADLAARRVDEALALGATVTAEQRGEVAIAVVEAKVLAHRAAMELSSQVFELTGPGASSSRLGLDRFWRNARVHTLHDPVDYKLRDLGRYALEGRDPEPGSYA